MSSSTAPARGPGLRAIDDDALAPMTEADLAADPRDPGRVVRHAGRYWRESFAGLFEPIHQMARLSGAQATRPAAHCWGFSAALAEPSSPAANASRPMHLLADVAGFDIEQLSPGRRYHLRRSLRDVAYARVVDVEPLAAEAYEVFRSAQARTGNPYRQVRSRDELVSELRWFTSRPSAVVLAGLIDGRLGGLLAGYAVDGTGYVELVDVATEALSSHVSIGLHHLFVELCRRSEGIREIAHSPHIPEDPGLGRFKAGIGFPVVQVPSRTWLAAPTGALLRRTRPFLYYRLTGRVTGPVAAAIDA